MFNSNCASVPLVANLDGNGSNGGWGDTGAWWIVLFVLFFAFGGFGGNGWGGNGYGNGYTDAAIQRGFDNQSVVSKLDGINNGICSLGYDQLAQMNGINTNILQTGFGIQQAINADTVSGMQNTNAIQSTLTNMAAQNASCCCETQRQIERGFDNSAVISKLDGITNGLCDGFYAVNNSMLTGFNGINTNIMQTGYGIQQAINADTVSGMQNTNAIQSTLTNMAAQNASCCCETQRQIERGFADTNYNMATQACQTRQAIADSTRQVIDFLTQDKIATLTAENNDLRRAASQDRQNALLTTAMTAQTNQIINAVNPTAIPAYVVPNPNAYAYGCGCNQSCGC